MWSPIINSSHHSLLLGLTKPIDLVKHAKSLNYSSVGLTDNSLGGAIEFLKEAKKQEIKPILGQRFNVGGGHLILIAQNTEGYYELVKLSFKANYADLTLEDIQGAKNLLCLTGSLNSNFGATLFGDKSKIYGVSSTDEAKDLASENWVPNLTDMLGQLKDIFGDKLFLQSQRIDHTTIYAAQICNEYVRYLGKELKIPLVATADSFYLNQNSAPDQRILLSSYAKSTLKSLRSELVKQEEYSLLPFLSSNKYYVPTTQEMEELHRGHEQEILNCDVLTEMVGPIDVLSPPVIPKFDCPEGKSSSEYLTELCREGWKRKVAGHVAKDKIGTYTQRIKHELEVLQGAALDDYFLIVQDYVAAAKKRGELIGPGRGSGAGCFTAYLLDITNADPIRFGLIFERFYNSGRNSPGHIALPDLDVDFPVHKRDNTVEYNRNKYGRDKVAKIITFNRIMGRSALKEVFHAHEACGFDLQNKITENIPDEAKIADDLELQRKFEGVSSIVKWALQENAEKLREYCYIDDEGKLQGPFAKHFEQAIRLEGTKKSAGKHASALYISPWVLKDRVPMVKDKSSDEPIIGVDMKSAEDIGLPKFDILAINALDKIMKVMEL